MRPIQPQNVVTGDGRVTDFGLAPPLSTATAADPSPGRSPRPAPSRHAQLRVPNRRAGPRWTRPINSRSARCSMKHTGVHLFRCATTRDDVGDVRRRGALIGQLNVAVPMMLRWAAERCLAKNPADWYASTADLSKDPQPAGRRGELTGEETRSIPAPIRSRWHGAHRRRSRAPGGFAAVMRPLMDLVGSRR